MREAVSEYAAHRDAPERWMLGRFVVPVSRLDELSAELPAPGAGGTAPVRLAAIGGADPRDDMTRIRAFNAAHADRAAVDVLETRVSTPGDVERAADAVGGDLALYLEVPVADDPSLLLDAVQAAGANAKVRTGGVTPDAFPSAAHVARFIVRCAERGVRWKATAGLHHPLRAEYPLTYADDAPRGTMFGFLNVFAAAALAHAGAPEADVARLLEERDPHALTFDDEAMCWHGRAVPLSQLAAVRDRVASSFGSCSFREPVGDLRRLGLL